MPEEEPNAEARVLPFAEQLPVVVWATDLDLRVRWAVGGDLRSRGVDADRMVGRSIAEIVEPDDVPEALRAHRLALRGESSRYEGAWDGSVFEVRVQSLRDPSGHIVGTAGAALDVSDRKHADEELAARARQQAAVATLGLSALRGVELQALLDEAVTLVARTLAVDHCKVMQLVEDDTLLLRAGVGWRAGRVGRFTAPLGEESLCGYSLQTGEPVVVEDFATDARFPAPPPLLHEHGVVSAASVLIRDHHRSFGVLGAYTRSHRVYTQDDLNFLQSIANVLATTVERHRVEAELREKRVQLQALSRRLLEAQEAERRAVARDLHDELGQLLTALKMDLRGLERRLGALDAPADRVGPLIDRAVAASALVDQTVATVQRIAADLRSGPLDRLGLGAALRCEARRFEERTGVRCEVRLADGLPELPTGVATALYRIAQEALTNVARHAGAQRVGIVLAAQGGEVDLRVEDDGRGIDGAAREALGLGLLGMHERASTLGGEVTIARGPAGGTVVTTRVPIAVAGAAGQGAPP